jgi:AsmA-like C-terminal region
MQIARRLARALVLGLAFIVFFAACGGWFLYSYITDKATVARWIRDYSTRYLPGSTVEPGRVHPSLSAGEVVLHDAQLRQRIDGVLFQALRIPYLSVQFNPRKLFKGHLELTQIVVSHPTLKLCRRRDGTWNLQGLLADPWPGPWLEHSPPILIENGTLELVTDDDAPAPAPAPGRSGPAQPAEGAIAQVSARGAGGAGLRTGGAPVPVSSASFIAARPGRAPVLLREVSIRIEQAAGFLYRFTGTARGDLFEKLSLEGTFDFDTGRLELSGELAGLTLSETLRRRLPPEARAASQALALNSGTIDLELHRFSFNPKAAAGQRVHYLATARLREGVWECPHLPFAINDLSAAVQLDDGRLTISKHAQGTNGLTGVRFWGALNVDDPSRAPMDVHVELTDLQLDTPRLRARTPPEYDELWDVFKPRGRIDVALDVFRDKAGDPRDFRARVRCRDVSAVYRHFAYPLDHLSGELTLQKRLLTLELQSSIDGRPLFLKGLIENPGDDAVVRLDIDAEAVPIDDTFKQALPPKVRKFVDQFQPSGSVKGHATVFRQPMVGPDPRPEGQIAIDAQIDLAERCEIKWADLPYPVRSLTGRLEIHPDRWVFKNMRGQNGQAVIEASGSVEKLPIAKVLPDVDPLKIDVFLRARNLPFSDELRLSLPVAWRQSWPTINPTGSCDVDAEVHVAPGIADNTHIVVVPRPESNVRLEITRYPQPNVDPGGTTELRLEDVGGRFVFDNGKVNMQEVRFTFRSAPVRFSHGTVLMADSGQFDLSVTDLWIDGIRLDSELRKKMTPLMAQFALRLDDGKTFRARGDLEIGWSGIKGDPAFCRWNRTLVLFLDNRINTGIPIEHIQGELNDVSGCSNGFDLQVHGIVKLASVSVIGQQITNFESPFHVAKGVAQLDNIAARFLGGDLSGKAAITLDSTPRYGASLQLRGAQLEEYARTVSGPQSYSGNIDAQIAINGFGGDVRNLSGSGEAHVTRGNLGALPPLMRIAQRLTQLLKISFLPRNSPSGSDKSAFDSADVAFTISQGLTTFYPIRFTGNAFSLVGLGTLDPQGNLDLRLNVLWGRDRFHIPLVSDLTRIASTPFLIVHVQGTPANPQFELRPLAQLGDVLRATSRNSAERKPP